MTQVKAVTLPEFLTEGQIRKASQLYAALGMDATDLIEEQVIEPNLATINKKLGQENDPRYLAYAVVYVLTQLKKAGAS